MNKIIAILFFFFFHSFSILSQTQIGSDIEGEATGDNFGNAVSMNSDGTRVAIGAWYNDGASFNAGHVRIFEESGGSWTQVGDDIDGAGFSNNFGEAVSINGDGTRVAVGAKNNSDNGSFSGQVKIFEENSGAWTQIGNDLNGGESYDNAGQSVTLNEAGTRVAIGVPGYDDGTVYQIGQVRIYDEVGGSWNLVGSIIGEGGNDFFGTSISMNVDGTRIAIGAPYNDGNGVDAGHVSVYEQSGGTWVQIGDDIDGDSAGDFAGYDVSLSSDGSTLAVGALYNDDNGIDAGQTRVYEEVNGVWTQIGSDIDGESAEDFAGITVDLAMNGTILAVGAPKNDGNGVESGHVRIYELSGGVWAQVGNDIDGEATGDWSGISISMDATGGRAAIGALFNNSNAGHVRVFNLTDPLPVTLTHFKANPTKETIQLTWQTATEQNNKGFELQKSIDGEQWEPLTFIEGRGTTELTQSYEYVDTHVSSKLNYYRLKQVDFDERFEYSKIISVVFDQLASNTSIYPNPTTNYIHLSLTKANQITVYNPLGQVLDHFQFQAGQYDLGLRKYNQSILLLEIGQEWMKIVVE